MAKLTFGRFKLDHVISVRQLSTVHYFTNLTNYDTPSHSHNLWEFVFCEKGKVSAWNGNSRTDLTSGEITFHQPGVQHRLHVGEKPTAMFIVAFSCSGECIKLFRNKRIRVTAEQRAIVNLIIDELNCTFELNDGQLQLSELHAKANAPVGAQQLICGYLEWLFISLIRNGVDTSEPDAVSAKRLEEVMEKRIITELCDCIDKHLTEQITIKMLSEHVHYSRAYITVRFKEVMGVSIMDYVESERIKRATQLLKSGEMSVTQVSEYLGYSSLQYFSRRFKNAVGVSPRVYATSEIEKIQE
ncbi:MAG: AraC family transcriptional regulator [Clostridia bacterium]|nr:AraC family transcriptional regulator [Clostridia bacterium]